MANLLGNISLILSLVLLAAAQCPTKDGSWIELNAPFAFPSGTFDFDNLGFTVKSPWSYFDSPLAVFTQADKNVYLSGTSGALLNGEFVKSGFSTWDGKSAWSDNNGMPGYYMYTNDPAAYLEFTFSYSNPNLNPTAVSMRVQGDSNVAASNFIYAFDADDNIIGCISNIDENGGLNNWFDLGLRTSRPIRKLRFQGITTADNFQFADPVCLSDSCDTNAWCFNNADNDGVVCACKSGYEGDGSVGNCSDKNECNTPAICAPDASCTNLPGSYNCTCNDGFEGDGFTNCTDINECDFGLCSPYNAYCTNLEGSYNCTCEDGFTGNGFDQCFDVDECAAGVCSPNATCINLEGSFNCTCVDGYDGDGITCADKNECSSNPCDVNASCINTEGSFSCKCNDGYTGDGKSCTKVEVPGTPVASPITSPASKTPTTKISSALRLTYLEALTAALLAWLL